MENLDQDTNLVEEDDECGPMMSTPVAYKDSSHYANAIVNNDFDMRHLRKRRKRPTFLMVMALTT